MEYGRARAEGRVAAPLRISYFIKRWAGPVAIDETTSGCVASVEAAPPTDSFILYQRALLPYYILCATREPCCVCPFPAPLFVEERCAGHWTQQRSLVSFTAPYFSNL